MGSMCKICSFIAMFGCIILINFYNKWSMSKICSFMKNVFHAFAVHMILSFKIPRFLRCFTS